jgi:DNA replication protein DnaC
MSKKTDGTGAANLSQTDRDALHAHLSALRLPFALANYSSFAQTAADKQWSHVQFLQELIRSEAAARADRRVERLVAQARFPVLKTLDRFDWDWPTKINRMMVQNLFHLDFVRQHSNVVFIAGVGLGKSHLMTALGFGAHGN